MTSSDDIGSRRDLVVILYLQGIIRTFESYNEVDISGENWEIR